MASHHPFPLKLHDALLIKIFQDDECASSAEKDSWPFNFFFLYRCFIAIAHVPILNLPRYLSSAEGHRICSSALSDTEGVYSFPCPCQMWSNHASNRSHSMWWCGDTFWWSRVFFFFFFYGREMSSVNLNCVWKPFKYCVYSISMFYDYTQYVFVNFFDPC